MTLRTISFLALTTSTVLSSCIYYTTPVPEMPYRANKQDPATTQAHNDAFAAALSSGDTWYTTPPGTTPATTWTDATIPPPAAGTQPSPLPATTTTGPAPTSITQPPLTLNPPVAITPRPATPTPAVTPKPATTITPKPATPAPSTTTPASKAANPKEITNNGPIPVATRVPNDPTRVYNPLDPSKTIRITDRNGNIYPSGKELKVRGTNFHFYVP